LPLEIGDLVVLCTDGIVEAMNSREQQFGLARLEAIIRSYAQASMQELVAEVGRQVTEHYAGDSPPDDLTILVLRRNG